jgi:hypothetical protein
MQHVEARSAARIIRVYQFDAAIFRLQSQLFATSSTIYNLVLDSATPKLRALPLCLCRAMAVAMGCVRPSKKENKGPKKNQAKSEKRKAKSPKAKSQKRKRNSRQRKRKEGRKQGLHRGGLPQQPSPASPRGPRGSRMGPSESRPTAHQGPRGLLKKKKDKVGRSLSARLRFLGLFCVL